MYIYWECWGGSVWVCETIELESVFLEQVFLFVFVEGWIMVSGWVYVYFQSRERVILRGRGTKVVDGVRLLIS